MTFSPDAEHRRLVATLLPGIAAAGILDALLAVEALLLSQEHHGAQRWRALSRFGLLSHLSTHVHEVVEDPHRTDHESWHLSAAHVASRALMVLQAVIEPGGWD